MEQPKPEIIKIGQLELRFLFDGSHTGDVLDMFELAVPPEARVPAAHFHRDVDEMVYGLDGIMTYTVDGASREIGPGDHCFVPRRAIHHFVNLHPQAARVLTVLSPATIGPQYFRELGALINAGGPPDLDRVKDIMLRHGLVAAPMPA